VLRQSRCPCHNWRGARRSRRQWPMSLVTSSSRMCAMVPVSSCCTPHGDGEVPRQARTPSRTGSAHNRGRVRAIGQVDTALGHQCTKSPSASLLREALWHRCALQGTTTAAWPDRRPRRRAPPVAGRRPSERSARRVAGRDEYEACVDEVDPCSGRFSRHVVTRTSTFGACASCAHATSMSVATTFPICADASRQPRGELRAAARPPAAPTLRQADLVG